MLDDEPNEIVAEVQMNVRGEVFDPRKNFDAFNDPWEQERWEWGILKLD